MLNVKNIYKIFSNELYRINNKAFAQRIGCRRFLECRNTIALGDSVFLRVSNTDTDKRNLGNILEKDNNDLTVFALQGLYSLHFLIAIAYLIDNGAKFKNIVLPINLRSFSPQWNMNPEWRQKDKLDYCISSLKDQSLAKLILESTPPNVNNLQYLDASVRCFGAENRFSVKEYRELVDRPCMSDGECLNRKKAIMTLHYMYVLENGNFVLDCWKSLISLLRKSKRTIRLYYTPINYEFGIRLFSSAFDKQITSNIQVINNALAPDIPVDLSRLIGEDGFFSISESTEHLNQLGRARLAERISKEIINEVNFV